MLGKKLQGAFKLLVKKVMKMGKKKDPLPQYERMLIRECDHKQRSASPPRTPTGSFAVYVGDERHRFVIPLEYLSHPLFRILLEKSYNEFGYEQQSGLVVPCSVAAFQELISVMQSSPGKVEFGHLVEELI